MGAVWLARDETLGRDVAIKRIGTAPGGESADLERAEREARLAARLNHPHVVAVFDLITEDDERWLVMEYVEGVTLSGLVQRDGALTPDQASPIIRQAADALTAAHAAGIVHRDVKPSNILVTADGQVKLSDFGIARAEADASLTQTGLVTGSPAYLAPEVASGQMATTASDVWSLGATLVPRPRRTAAVRGRRQPDGRALPHRARGAAAPGRSGVARAAARGDDDPRSRPPLVDGAGAGRPGRGSGRDLGPPRAGSGPDPGDRATRRCCPRPCHRSSPRPHHRRRPATGRCSSRAAVVLLVGLIAGRLLATRIPSSTSSPPGDDGRDIGLRPPSSTTPQPSPTRPDGERGGHGAVHRDYLATAPPTRRPASTMLTPEFQQESGGLEGYRELLGHGRERRAADDPGRPGGADGRLHGAYEMDSSGPGSGRLDRRREPDPGVRRTVTYKIAGES